jgi:hypothetical protein
MPQDEYSRLEGGGEGDRTYEETTPAPGHPPLNESLTGVPSVMPGFVPPASDAAGYDAWNYRADVPRNPTELRAFHVEASDGRIGKVHSSSDIRDNGYLTVDIGLWIFGRTVLIPAGTVNHIDYDERVVYLDRTKEQVKASPEFSAEHAEDPQARQALHDYYKKTYTQPE